MPPFLRVVVRYAALPVALLLAALILRAQDPEAPSKLQLGERLFLLNCAQCHGPEGDAIPGTDIGHGKFRRASSDADLVSIIKNGIPGTAMPPHTFTGFAPGVASSESQVNAIVAYLHYLAESAVDESGVKGNKARGKVTFEGKGECLNCHSVRGRGSHSGPDLSDIGASRRPSDLQRSILDPNAEILPQNRSFRVVTRAGSTYSGRLLNQDTFSVQLMDKEKVMSFWKSDLKNYEFVDGSPMPSYKGMLTAQEVSDIVAYLASLKGTGKP